MLNLLSGLISLALVPYAKAGPRPAEVHSHWRFGLLWESGLGLPKFLSKGDFLPHRWRPGIDQCEHGAERRHCWSNGFGIDTDQDREWPNTGNVVKYDFEISKVILAPDGVPKELMAINGQFPGPTITADWGDMIEVNVRNLLDTNGTGIHWHGVRQFGSNHMDGTGGITECPIAVGETRKYRFRATQHGTSWYHSHYSVQYGEGVLGGIVIRGPSTANYDVDLGWFPFMDWFHAPIFVVNNEALHAAGPPQADNILVNGSMKSPNGGHKYSVTTLQPGKRHLLRLINTGINNHVHVSLDGHPFEVVAADFVPIVPYSATSISIAVGQRYDVIIEANQTVADYWLRVSTGGDRCDGPNKNADNVRSIFHYEGSTTPPPQDTVKVKLATGCQDEKNLVPYIKTRVPEETPEELTLNFTAAGTGGGLVTWLVNGSNMIVDLSNPTLQSLLDINTDFQAGQNIIRIGQEETEWTYWVIQQAVVPGAGPQLPHPIHLHGHDFFILDSATNATWSGNISRLNFDNPTRRDTATLPAAGYLVLAFQSDNPGAWLMHCHIPFHISAGLGLQFLEREEEIRGNMGGGGMGVTGFKDECGKWKRHVKRFFPGGFAEGDSLV